MAISTPKSTIISAEDPSAYKALTTSYINDTAGVFDVTANQTATVALSSATGTSNLSINTTGGKSVVLAGITTTGTATSIVDSVSILNTDKDIFVTGIDQSTTQQFIYNNGGTGVAEPATNTTLGGIIVGDGLSVDADGVLSLDLPQATTSVLGGVKVDGSTIVINDLTGVISATGGGGEGGYTLPVAGLAPNGNLGGVKIGANMLIDSNGVLSTLPNNTYQVGVSTFDAATARLSLTQFPAATTQNVKFTGLDGITVQADAATSEITFLNSGVTKILAGTGVTLTSTNNDGTGEVTINSTGGGTGSEPATIGITTTGTGLKFNNSFTASVTGTGTFTLSGTLFPTFGGTGYNTYTYGDMLYGTANNNLAKLQIGLKGQVLMVDGTTTLLPVWKDLPSTSTTYTLSAETDTGGAAITLTGSDASTDAIKLAAGSNITISRTDANTITITGTSSGGGTGVAGVSKVISGTGITLSSSNGDGTGDITISNSGVTSITSTDLSVTGTGAVTLGLNTISATKGGTGQTTYAVGDILFANSTSTLSRRTIGNTGQVLTVVSGLPQWADPATSGGTGTVTTVSVASANGFAGTVATADSTPAITLKTTVNGILVGNSTTGVVSAVTIGSGLSFSGGTLSASGGGTGTVTSVSFTAANGFTGSITSSTTTPAISVGTSVTGLLKGNGTGVSAAVSGTDYAPATSGTSILYGNGSGGFSSVTIGSGLSFTGGTLAASGGGGGTGTVTSVGISGGTTGLTTTGGPITSSGTITLGGTLGVGNGGTGLTSFAAGDIIFATAANTLGKLAKGNEGQVLKISGGVPAWGPDISATTTGTVTSVTVSSGDLTVTGSPITTSGIITLTLNTVPYNKGGTGITSYSKGDIIYASASNTLNKLPIGTTDGHVLTVNTTTGVPEWRAAPSTTGSSSLAVLDESTSLTSAATSLNFTGAGVTATNNSGAITVNIPGGSGGTSTPEVVVFKYTAGGSGNFSDSATCLVSQTSGVTVTIVDGVNCIVSFSFTGKTNPPKSIMTYAQNCAATGSNQNFTVKDMSAATSGGSGTLFGGTTLANPEFIANLVSNTYSSTHTLSLTVPTIYTGASVTLPVQRAHLAIVFGF